MLHLSVTIIFKPNTDNMKSHPSYTATGLLSRGERAGMFSKDLDKPLPKIKNKLCDKFVKNTRRMQAGKG